MSSQQTLFNWFGAMLEPGFMANPYPTIQSVREGGPIQQDESSGAWFVLGHDAFTKITRSPLMGSDTRLMKGTWDTPENREQQPLSYRLFRAFQPQMLNVNPPDHRRMRRTYEPFFTPSNVAKMEPMIKALIQRLLDAMPDQGQVDMIQAFARPLPFRVILEMFGVPPIHDEKIAAWSAKIMRISEFIMTEAEQAEALAALEEFKTWAGDFINERRQNPGDAPIDAVISSGPPNGALNHEEVVLNLVTMIISGHKTTVSLLGNAVLTLLQHPEQTARLRADMSLMKTAVEELMRWEPGAYIIPRVAIDDFTYGDVTAPKGGLCLGLTPAVNRDPAAFENAETLDFARRPNPHMSFGGGIHHCLGAPLARLEAKLALGMLLERFGTLEPAGEAQWMPHCINNHCLLNLPVRVKR